MDAAVVWTGILQIATVLLILALLYRPLGDWIARVFTSEKDWRVERGMYRLVGVDPQSQQTWQAYTRGVLAFSLIYNGSDRWNAKTAMDQIGATMAEFVRE